MTTGYATARSNFYKANTDGVNRHWSVNERIFLLDYLSLPNSAQTNHDLFKILFRGLGYTGSLADMWYQFTGSLGYTGSLRQRQVAFWEGGSFP